MPKEEMDTRTKIIMATVDLLNERSYKKVSVDEIARKAGVSKGGLFHHFSSKYELASTAVMWWAENMMNEGIDDAFFALVPKEQIRFFIDKSIEVVVKDFNMGHLILEIYEEAIEREEDLTLWLDFLNQYVGVVEDIFKNMGCKHPRARALLMLSGIDGFAMYYLMLQTTDGNVDIEQIKLELYDLYIGDE